MLTQQRHEIILKLLKEKGSITVTEVRDLLDTSESTVRRDITALDKEGKLEKVFGGAVEAGPFGSRFTACRGSGAAASGQQSGGTDHTCGQKKITTRNLSHSSLQK